MLLHVYVVGVCPYFEISTFFVALSMGLGMIALVGSGLAGVLPSIPASPTGAPAYAREAYGLPPIDDIISTFF